MVLSRREITDSDNNVELLGDNKAATPVGHTLVESRVPSLGDFRNLK